MRKLLLRLALFSLLVITLQLIISLDYHLTLPWNKSTNAASDSLPFFSVRVPDPGTYKPSEEMLQIQKHLSLKDDIGFLWAPNLDSAANVVLQWNDQPPFMLSTDASGFINSPDAIVEKGEGRKIDIVGLGASFMQGASYVLYDFFWIYDRFYYNMATHRHTFPMYNKVLTNYALNEKPTWIVYGVNEGSPAVIDDYEEWEKSNTDWFSYHSGTWTGPPKQMQYHIGPVENIPVVNNLTKAALRRVYPKKSMDISSPQTQVQKTGMYTKEAYQIAKREGINFLVVYIPAKQTIFEGSSPMSNEIDRLLRELDTAEIPYVDLRTAFRSVPDPRSLYFAVDGHWNRDGQLEAAKAIWNRMQELAPQ